MQQKPQFTLRSLALLVAMIGALLAMMRGLEPEWRFILAVAGVTFVMSLLCLATCGRTVRSVKWCMLIAVSIASGWLLWLGLHPALYYMAGFFFAMMLWGGVLVGSLIIAATSSASSGSAAPRARMTAELAFLIIPLVTTLLLAFQIPLRLGAGTAVPMLASKISEQDSTSDEQQCGLYTVRLPGRRRGRTPEQVYFVLADDSESAFVYSPNGIDDITYNAGSKGHLFGDWYWIKED